MSYTSQKIYIKAARRKTHFVPAQLYINIFLNWITRGQKTNSVNDMAFNNAA